MCVPGVSPLCVECRSTCISRRIGYLAIKIITLPPTGPPHPCGVRRLSRIHFNISSTEFPRDSSIFLYRDTSCALYVQFPIWPFSSGRWNFIYFFQLQTHDCHRSTQVFEAHFYSFFDSRTSAKLLCIIDPGGCVCRK